MAVRMLRLADVLDRTGLSATTLWRFEKQGTFPRRRRVGPNLVAWRSDEVDEWIDALQPVATADESADAA